METPNRRNLRTYRVRWYLLVKQEPKVLFQCKQQCEYYCSIEKSKRERNYAQPEASWIADDGRKVQQYYCSTPKNRSGPISVKHTTYCTRPTVCFL